MSDLVKRARHNANADMPHHASVELIETMADRIEELEAKLAKALSLADEVVAFGCDEDQHAEWLYAKSRLDELKGQE